MLTTYSLEVEEKLTIAGTWYIAGPGPGQLIQMSFFPDGTYAHLESGSPEFVENTVITISDWPFWDDIS